jgi:hypothetical protein
MPDMPGWSQDDYHSFWGSVIENYAGRVFFMKGWNYSSGCTYEFLVAHRSGARVLDQASRPLSVAKGQEMIHAAIEELRNRGLPIDQLERIWITLRNEAQPPRSA